MTPNDETETLAALARLTGELHGRILSAEKSSAENWDDARSWEKRFDEEEEKRRTSERTLAAVQTELGASRKAGADNAKAAEHWRQMAEREAEGGRMARATSERRIQEHAAMAATARKLEAQLARLKATNARLRKAAR